MSRYIDENIKRRLYAESMGRCMNPDCMCELFWENGDVIEKAHIDPYCETADNTFENLVLLCPTCHTDFDKNHAFTPKEVLHWKAIRRDELKKYFSKRFSSFDDFKKEVVPLLLENRAYYENYYVSNHRELWDKFEYKILANNRKLRELMLANIDLIQWHKEPQYSNQTCVFEFIAHIEEFEMTRSDKEKTRQILFPEKINSIFGIESIRGFVIPSTESLERLIKSLKEQGKFIDVHMGIARPYIQIQEDGKIISFFVDDTPQLRQQYYMHDCFVTTGVRLENLNFALKYLNSKRIKYRFIDDNNLREIYIGNVKMVFVYEYCLSKTDLMQLSPDEGTVIVNLHNWNGDGCISSQAYKLAEDMDVKLLTMEAFYEYVRELEK